MDTHAVAAHRTYAAGLVPALFLAGPLSDTLGRRRVAIPGIALSAEVAVPVAMPVSMTFAQGAGAQRQAAAADAAREAVAQVLQRSDLLV